MWHTARPGHNKIGEFTTRCARGTEALCVSVPLAKRVVSYEKSPGFAIEAGIDRKWPKRTRDKTN